MTNLRGRITSIFYPKKEQIAFSTSQEFFGFHLEYKDQKITRSVRCLGKCYKIFIGEEVSLEGKFAIDKYGNPIFRFNSLIIDYDKSIKHTEYVREIIGTDYFRIIRKNVGSERVAREEIVNALNREDYDYFLNKGGIPKSVVEVFLKNHKTIKSLSTYQKQLLDFGLYESDIRKILVDKSVREIEDIISYIKTNPYKLMNKCHLSFRNCDYIASKGSVTSNAPSRIIAAILTGLKSSYYDESNVYVTYNALIEKTYEMLDSNYFSEQKTVDIKEIEFSLERLVASGYIVKSKGKYYLKEFFEEESTLKEFCKYARLAPKNNYTDIPDFINYYENTHNIKLGREQKIAVENSLNSLISVITGGAGVGKTSSLACIITYLIERLGYKVEDIALCAPTGKASARMKESIYAQTGHKFTASTIHTLLAVRPTDDTLETFRYSKDNPLNKKVVVVDETSMLNYKIAYSLISALKKGTKVIFLGDIEQLEPVGTGCFLRDAIEASIPTTHLKEVHRQGKNSTILSIATAIRDEVMEDCEIKKKTDDFAFVEVSDDLDIDKKLDIIYQIFRIAKEKSSIDDVMIITPLRENETNTKIDSKRISNYIQDRLMPDTKEPLYVPKNGFKFKVGSKVIVTKNNNRLGIVNGQIGYIKFIDFDREEFVVSFDNEELRLSKEDTDNLRLAYAITVHKSQGSDWQNVIYCCFNDNTMNKKNLVYTAVTRAKNNLVVVGNKKVFENADKLVEERKNSSLKED